MKAQLYPRLIEPTLKNLAALYPVLTITGPRQSGKTTLAKTLFSRLPYLSFENLDTREEAQLDPRSFLNKYRQGAIFDEVQHVADLISYLQEIADESPRDGRFVLTGSQNFALSSTVSQSLAGRTAIITLLPLSIKEIGRAIDPNTAIFKGGYPSVHAADIPVGHFFSSYLQSYVERDIRQVRNIENLSVFQRFLKLCAGRIGQFVNFESLAQDAGISTTTAHRWLNLLEATYIVFRLAPFHKNYSKRLTKMPKLYFYDTGLACALLGLEEKNQLDTHYLRGGLYENLVILEILKRRLGEGKLPNIYFWRSQTGYEIDLIGEWAGSIHAMEIKSSMTFKPEHLKNLEYFKKLDPEAKAYLIYNGVVNGGIKSIELVPLTELDKLLLG